MKRDVVFALAAVLLIPLSLAAQDPQGRIQAAESKAATAGIPVSLLQNRIAEGRAKGVPLERIAAVVERRADALIAARTAMGRASDLTAADLNAGADAVEAGIDAASLRTVIEQSRGEDRPVAIAVLTYLHDQQGLPVGQALQEVTRALKNGPEALRNLPAQTEGRRGHGQGTANGRGRGRGNGPPDHAGQGGKGPPSAVPDPGKKPGSGKPNGVGKGKGNGGKGNGNGGKGNGKGNGNGKPPGGGGGRPG